MFKFDIGPILTTPPKTTATSRHFAETTPYQPPITEGYEVTLKKTVSPRSQKSFFFSS